MYFLINSTDLYIHKTKSITMDNQNRKLLLITNSDKQYKSSALNKNESTTNKANHLKLDFSIEHDLYLYVCTQAYDL